MTSFREIPVNIITHDTIMGRSMHNIDHDAHERLDRQMREWERNNNVTVVPMGASSETTTNYAEKGSIGGKIAAQTKKANARRKNLVEISRSKRNKSGHQNLSIVGDQYKVFINKQNLGIFPKEEAIRVRDEYRFKNNMLPAEY